ncbi:LADA_0A04654g1_1 [Lachancea dasiensis]|uniref:LADA_0A04654g1_1 n=1 Tax=Lachancea dasiensis TaxID=1072105 RepID=A0A1G4INQ6_9SACH|nr:LADA_0A04654g1_1 [Lachancea dasiensis]
MSEEHHIDYSQLLSQLLDEKGELNDTITSFLYHLFPEELFVRAMSLLDSNDMFIYVYDKLQTESKHIKSISTEPDEPEAREALSGTSNEMLKTSEAAESRPDAGANSKDIAHLLYEGREAPLNRLIVKPETPESPPICVDLDHWFCSCEEYNCQFRSNLLNVPEQPAGPVDLEESSLYSRAIVEHELKSQAPHSDRFAQVKSLHLQFQRYFRHELAMCPHLLAFAILLQTSSAILMYFTHTNATVYLITVQNLDEWLKLHLNVIQ